MPRGCGKARKVGGIYAVCDFSNHGLPLSSFMICPPVKINPGEIGLSSIGIALLPRDSEDRVIWDMWDIVGKEHYPYFPDFVEEAIHLGTFSRRVPRSTDFTKLTRASRHMLVFPRGTIVNGQEHYKYASQIETWNKLQLCPHDIDGHQDGSDDVCTGMLWQSFPHGEHTQIIFQRNARREIPSGTDYKMFIEPDGANTEFDYALTLWLPITRFEVIDDPYDGTDEQAIDTIKSSGTNIPITLETF